MSDKAIKSVRRVFEILELFDKQRRPLTAKEIGDELGYPLTSAHALLKSMQQMGYADFDAPRWTYTPSRKFSLMSSWVADYLDRETQILDCMSLLNKETKETINLSRFVDDAVKIVHGLECVHTVGVSVKVGTLMPATESLTGVAALAALSGSELEQYFKRLERIHSDQTGVPNQSLIDDVRSELEAKGTVARNDLFIQGIGAVCLPVRTRISKETMVIGVVGPSDRISQREEKHRSALKRVAAEYAVDCIF